MKSLLWQGNVCAFGNVFTLSYILDFRAVPSQFRFLGVSIIFQSAFCACFDFAGDGRRNLQEGKMLRKLSRVSRTSFLLSFCRSFTRNQLQNKTHKSDHVSRWIARVSWNCPLALFFPGEETLKDSPSSHHLPRKSDPISCQEEARQAISPNVLIAQDLKRWVLRYFHSSEEPWYAAPFLILYAYMNEEKF